MPRLPTGNSYRAPCARAVVCSRHTTPSNRSRLQATTPSHHRDRTPHTTHHTTPRHARNSLAWNRVRHNRTHQHGSCTCSVPRGSGLSCADALQVAPTFFSGAAIGIAALLSGFTAEAAFAARAALRLWRSLKARPFNAADSDSDGDGGGAGAAANGDRLFNRLPKPIV